ncbi:outer membrane lipoprotein [Acidimangrovimonas pyrenivorans]|uniref:17 kDa surface antigen n=1 Tax=Acidimangrovimonas pyrenivorans TaxID=2030798 RepID=A0ABV7AGE0_9RHOB
MNKRLLILPLCTLMVAGCVDNGPGPYTQPPPVQQQAHVRHGTIIGVRNVEMRRNTQGDQVAGALVGGIVGGIIGNQFGEGSGKSLMTGAGAATGAVVGSNMAKRTSSGTYWSQAWEIRLDSGRVMTIIQSSNTFRVGQRVRVITRDGRTWLASQ